MKNTRKPSSKLIVGSAIAAAVLGFSSMAQAQVSRGVPGVDVDTRTTGQPATNGVPGVNVDVGSRRSNGVPGVDADLGNNRRDAAGMPGVDVDTRRAGAGADMSGEDRLRMRADRN